MYGGEHWVCRRFQSGVTWLGCRPCGVLRVFVTVAVVEGGEGSGGMAVVGIQGEAMAGSAVRPLALARAPRPHARRQRRRVLLPATFAALVAACRRRPPSLRTHGRACLLMPTCRRPDCARHRV